jgi:hypothetical protein
MSNFNLNQIVKGTKAGTFVIVGFRTVGFDDGVQVKEVNQHDYTQVAKGEIFLPFSAIKAAL